MGQSTEGRGAARECDFDIDWDLPGDLAVRRNAGGHRAVTNTAPLSWTLSLSILRDDFRPQLSDNRTRFEIHGAQRTVRIPGSSTAEG